ncbi:MAG: AlpA family phage regulatory protein [bacterium]|nr:AlpA family phage regulatory protein [bacterium]
MVWEIRLQREGTKPDGTGWEPVSVNNNLDVLWRRRATRPDYDDKLLTLEQVAAEISVNESTVRRWWKDPDNPFPEPRRMGALLRWKGSEIQKWIRGLPSVRDAP